MKISDQLCEKIEEQIATGALPPGCALDEATLAEQHWVSRTPGHTSCAATLNALQIQYDPERPWRKPDPF